MSNENETTSVVDSWLIAVGAWTQEIIDSEWSVYLGEWPNDYATPAIMWQVTGMELRQLGRSSYELEKQLMATIVGSTRNEEIAAAHELMEALGIAVKIPLNAEKRRYLSVSNSKITIKTNTANTEQLNGQLTVTLTRRIGSYPAEEMALMQSVNYKSNMR